MTTRSHTPAARCARSVACALALLPGVATAQATAQVAAQVAPGGGTFAARLQEIMARPEFVHSDFGVALYDLAAKRMVFGLRADKFFTPGSTTKLLTAGTALALLGAEHRFHTPIYRTGPVANGTLRGDLVLVASGDPNLSGRISAGDTLAFRNHDHSYGGDPTTESVPGDPLLVVRELAGQVAAAGIRRVEGRVLVDASLFPEGEREAGSGVVISPVSVNDNVVDVTIGPGAKPGDATTVKLSPDVGYLRVINEATTGAADVRPRVRWASDSADAQGVHTVRITGTFPAGVAPISYAYAVPEPTRFAETALTVALRDRGVTVVGRRAGTAPDFGRLAASYTPANRVAEHVSLPLSEAVKVILKVSQNLHASMTPYILGALVSKKHGDDALQAGFDAERAFLEKAGLDIAAASQGDGAGGAPGAFYTPEFMVHYLAYMATRSDSAAFARALPILGRDGTLWNIQPNSPAAGKVMAKTGTYMVGDPLNQRLMLTGKGLAGYMTTVSGRRLAFAIYANRVPRPSNIGDPALLVGQALGEIAAAAYSLPLDQ